MDGPLLPAMAGGRSRDRGRYGIRGSGSGYRRRRGVEGFEVSSDGGGVERQGDRDAARSDAEAAAGAAHDAASEVMLQNTYIYTYIFIECFVFLRIYGRSFV